MQSKAKARGAIRWLWTRALVLGLVSSALPLVSCLEPHIERYTFKVEVLNRTASTYLCVSSALQLDTDYLESRNNANSLSAGGIVFGSRNNVKKLSGGAMVIQPIGPPCVHLMQLKAEKTTDFEKVAVAVVIWKVPKKGVPIQSVLSTEPAFLKVFYHPEFTFELEEYTYLPFAEIEITEEEIRVLDQKTKAGPKRGQVN